MRGCGAKLRWLSLAGNPWSGRRANRDPPPSLRQFFTACLALDHLDLSHCRLPQDALKYCFFFYPKLISHQSLI